MWWVRREKRVLPKIQLRANSSPISVCSIWGGKFANFEKIFRKIFKIQRRPEWIHHFTPRTVRCPSNPMLHWNSHVIYTPTHYSRNYFINYFINCFYRGPYKHHFQNWQFDVSLLGNFGKKDVSFSKRNFSKIHLFMIFF